LKKIRILLADDHAVVREGTRRVLEQEPDLEVVAEASDGEEAVRLATEFTPDVALIDIVMPNVNGIEATKRIKGLCPAVIVLILSAYDDDQFVFSLLEAGAAGYLLKSVHGRELVAAIRAVREGESVLHPLIARKVLGRFVPTPGMPVVKSGRAGLSEGEMEVMKLATRGLSNRDIARELCLSLRTVQARFTRAFRKLQVSSRTEAVLRGLKEGWLSLDDMRSGASTEAPEV
jgi:NarL family two-component system response regulator LiaR